MNDSVKTVSKKAGMPPGSLIHVGKRKTDKVKVSVIDYDEENYTRIVCSSAKECFPFRDTDTVSWINVDGLHDTEAIASIGEYFNLHPLLVEDVLNTGHRPKIEEFDEYIFLSLKMISISKNSQSIVVEQVSFVLGKKWVICFQEQEGDIFEALRIRLQQSKGKIRQLGNDYLLYRLIDTVVDNYFFVAEYIGEATETLEAKVLASPDNEALQEIQNLKKQLIDFRKSVYPLREAISQLQNDDTSFIVEDTFRYLRDVYEHIIQLIDNIEIQRDLLANIMDLYYSGVSNRMNQVMKVLTIIATIFIPLTFIAGIYGMNFEYMPELHWKYGYFGVWGLMCTIIILMMVYFRKKHWL